MGLYLTVPDDSIERFIQIVCVFIIYPVTVLLLRKFWKYYYDRRLSKADDEIKPLEKKKEWLLKSVMEKVSKLDSNVVKNCVQEPYNKAREILKRYGANQFEVPKVRLDPMSRHQCIFFFSHLDQRKISARNSSTENPLTRQSICKADRWTRQLPRHRLRHANFNSIHKVAFNCPSQTASPSATWARQLGEWVR